MTSTPGLLGLKQYTKDVPPGWRPRSYPIREYRDYLGIWAKLTRLDENQLGPAIMSRLEGGALRLALSLRVDRLNDDGQPTIAIGTDAVSLPAQDPVFDQVGNQMQGHSRRAPTY